MRKCEKFRIAVSTGTVNSFVPTGTIPKNVRFVNCSAPLTCLALASTVDVVVKSCTPEMFEAFAAISKMEEEFGDVVRVVLDVIVTSCTPDTLEPFTPNS